MKKGLKILDIFSDQFVYQNETWCPGARGHLQGQGHEGICNSQWAGRVEFKKNTVICMCKKGELEMFLRFCLGFCQSVFKILPGLGRQSGS